MGVPCSTPWRMSDSPIPVIIPLCLSGDSIHEITWDNFGKQVRLYLYERRVSA